MNKKHLLILFFLLTVLLTGCGNNTNTTIIVNPTMTTSTTSTTTSTTTTTTMTTSTTSTTTSTTSTTTSTTTTTTMTTSTTSTTTSTTTTTTITTTTTTTTSTTTTTVLTTQAWPGETWQEAELLTSLDPDFQNNMSGAFWNQNARTFWVCCNGGPSAFWALVENGSGSFKIATNEVGTQAKFVLPNGDFEGICQADLSEEVVYVMDESTDTIEEYNVSVYGTATFNGSWDITDYVPAYDSSSGCEGITFVPDAWLSASGFVDGDGDLYPASQNGMGGLFFVAHQNGGRIYVFDLNRTTRAVTFVGSYKTRRSESSGLEFDRSTGLLYIWHNTGANYLEVSDLSSYLNGERYLTPVAEFLSPKTGNLEGIAISSPDNWALIVDDDNQNDAALMWFKQFDPGF